MTVSTLLSSQDSDRQPKPPKESRPGDSINITRPKSSMQIEEFHSAISIKLADPI